MLIGINGKIGSGKDTVGSIIQGLIVAKEHNILNPNFEWIEKFHINSSFKIKKFAGKLKQIAFLLTGIDVESFEDQDFKNTTLSEEWDFADDDAPDNIMTVRMFLQKLGTEAMRNGLHTNVWVNALFADYIPVVKEWDEFGNDTLVEYPNWIITDMRFSNELEAIVEKGGITIRVVRPGTAQGTHPSEIALDGHIMHYEIINDGSIEDLIERVREILTDENIL